MARIPTAPAPRRRHPVEIAIDAALEADNGVRFRQLQEKWLPTIKDAYRGEEDPFRSHLGASQIGRECDRELFYGWRWAGLKKIPARLGRLFNRGHLEEGRFLALLEMIGVVFHVQPDGGQERISAHGGHFGSALDGVAYNVPGMEGEWVLTEFKTSSTKQFCALVAAGSVLAGKPEHYAQIQSCMARRGIYKCLYMIVNKNDDDLYCETIDYNPSYADHVLGRAGRIIFATTAPPKLSEDPSHFKCKMCDRSDVCHYKAPVLRNCRTCQHSVADPGGTWGCALRNVVLDKEAQKKGCDQYAVLPDFAQ